ncbi:MAG TPA: hypothetical protein VFO91_08560 [Anaerolineales bacterium]|nr:hypothetical protein [Anaerolineales bacterium]
MQKHRNIIVLVLILIVSLSCRFLIPEATRTPVPVTEPPAQTEPPTVTLPVLTSTPLAPTSTPAPTSLNPSGPYILYGGEGGIWISNPDGSLLTKITDLPIDLDDLHRAISPSGDRMALIVSNDEGLDLFEVRIPGGETKTIAHLLSITQDELISNPLSPKAFAAYAIRDYDNIAWQPGDGQLLAFMGAMDGPTSDLYLYDTQTSEITQLTDGPAQGAFPNWSPDGKYILHYGVSWRGPFGGAIIGHDHLDGVWAVRVADGEVITLPTPKSISFNFVGWQDEGHYITYDSDETCYSQNLRSVDVVTGRARPIMDLSFYSQIARSPETETFLFAGAVGCSNSPGDGVFLLLPGQTTPTKLLDKKAYEVRWLPESRVFQAYPEALFSPDGRIRYNPPVYDKSFEPAVSQKGYEAWEVIENQKGRVEVRVPGADWQTILDGSVEELIWDPATGETLLIVLRDGSLYAASHPDFAPRQVGNVDGVRQMIWLP